MSEFWISYILIYALIFLGDIFASYLSDLEIVEPLKYEVSK